ncbi:hypothetical protein [Marinobacterium stanieri]|uniref:hypothetical protein n=1 Tax=Marinobacterium stanieri TaxID=49186 RepID=UPI003A930A2A
MTDIIVKVRPCLNKVALWIKEYRHALRVIGGIFFCLALLAGLFWIGGKEIEPVAFVLGLLSSLFFASPSVAEYILPDRKPVKEMTFDEILDFIPETDPESDWYGISRDWSSEYFLREDPRLRFRAKFGDEGIQCEDFKEDWANCHPNSKATGYWYDLYYDGAFLDRIILVAVDGARTMLPTPDFKSRKIKLYNYRVAQIHDSTKSLDDYIRRSNLEVENS